MRRRFRRRMRCSEARLVADVSQARGVNGIRNMSIGGHVGRELQLRRRRKTADRLKGRRFIARGGEPPLDS